MLFKRHLCLVFIILFDALSAIISWTLFFIYRKFTILEDLDDVIIETLADQIFYWEIVLVTIGWLFLYLFTGFYDRALRQTKYHIIEKTILQSVIGTFVLFLIIVVNDTVFFAGMLYYYLLALFVIHFCITLLFRLLVNTEIRRLIRKKSIGFNTIIIGSEKNALDALNKMEKSKISEGFIVLGYVKFSADNQDLIEDKCKFLGNFSDFEEIIKINNIDNIIISTEQEDSETMKAILYRLSNLYNVTVYINQNLNPLIHSKVSINLRNDFTNIISEPMVAWQRSVKRFVDIFLSILMLIIVSPLMLYAIFRIKTTSKGSVFYTQERMGQYGKIFHIYKFRSMCVDAEKDLPLLSSDDDNRITPFGKIMRKYRIDELPQIFNILKGDMSLVGPRPERKYYVDILTEKAPQYSFLLKVKPGLTSLGEIKYGYASNIDEMLERMSFDLLYLDNLSLATDLKIYFFTIFTVLRGEGK